MVAVRVRGFDERRLVSVRLGRSVFGPAVSDHQGPEVGGAEISECNDRVEALKRGEGPNFNVIAGEVVQEISSFPTKGVELLDRLGMLDLIVPCSAFAVKELRIVEGHANGSVASELKNEAKALFG